MEKISRNPILTATLLIIAIGSGLLDYFLPSMGDDLVFWTHLGLHDYTVPNRKTISFILAHIFGCNGRLFDYMGPIVTNLMPKGAASVIMGAMAGLFFFSVLFAAGISPKRRTAFSLVLLTITLAAMPWWDSMFLRVCQFNYSWGTTFCLLFIGLYFRPLTEAAKKRRSLWLLFFIGFFAGATHEQTGVAMCATFFLYLIVDKRYQNLSRKDKFMLAGLMVGTILPVGAPSIWLRASQETVGQTFGLLLFTTLPILLLLLLITGCMLLTTKGRAYVRSLAKGEWGVLVCAAVISGIIALASGIPGRTGFFSEAAAIVALARMALTIDIRISRTLAGAISVMCLTLITAHFIVSVKEQYALQQEYDAVKDAYAESVDGIVYFDYRGRYDVSLLTLNRVKGVADADDFWNLHALEIAYGSESKIPVVLPTALKGQLESMTDSVTDGSTTVYTSKPANVVLTLDDIPLQYYPGPAPRMITHTLLSDGREIWIATPRVRDPGDYALPVKALL